MPRRILPVAPLVALLGTACADRTPVEPAAAPQLAANVTPDGAGVAREGTAGRETFTNRVTLPVTFDMAKGTCGLTADVRGTGAIDHLLHLVRNRRGEVTGYYRSQARGVATGSDGSRYVWRYDVNARVLDAAGLPTNPTDLQPPSPLTAYFVDNFALVGRGRAPDVRVYQRFILRVDANGTPTLERLETVGDPACDPI